jgi:predicted anti-sigma-YlaC factor YlaD
MSTMRAAVVCDRFREQISLSLDGELSQLERRMLDAHLARCPSCEAFADDLTTFTRELRSAPLERPRRVIVVQRPRRITTARLQVGIAAAFAFAALGLGTQLSTQEHDARGTHSDVVTRYPTDAELVREISIIETANDPPISPRSGVL